MTHDDIIQLEIADGIIHGAAVLVGDSEQNLYEQGYGLAAGGSTVPMTPETLIDIASVTKVLATTTALLICHDRGLVDFDAPVIRYLPEITGKAANVTLRHLAAHTSGYGAAPGETQRPYSDDDGREILRKILKYPPVREPGEMVEYACWNFLLLGAVVERVTGEPLAGFCRREIFEPLEMHETSMSKPVTDDPARLAQTMGTQKPGEISDWAAFRIYRDGGCAGNAGVFSSARDLAKFCRCLLKHGHYGHGKRLFSEEMFAEITSCSTGAHVKKRSFGWILDDESTPASASGNRIWHSGWSGQTVFIDLDKQLFVILLTTRCGDYDRAKKDRFLVVDSLLAEFAAEL